MDKKIFYFSSEDGGITELLPEINYEEIIERLRSFGVIDKNGKVNKVYNQTPFKSKISDVKIQWSELRRQLNTIFIPYDEVRFENTPEKVEETFFALENVYGLFLGSFDRESKDVTWLEFVCVKQNEEKVDGALINKIVEVLSIIGRKYGLLLLDWKTREIISLKDEQKIGSYIKKKLGV